MLDAVPDAVVLADLDGTIVDANEQACRLFGYDRDDLVGRPVERLLPESLRDRHVGHRTRFTANPTARPMGEGQDLFGLHRTGRKIPVDIGLAPMTTTQGPVVAAFIRDATVRREAVQARQRLHDAQVARRHALEVNDNVLQGLTTALWQLEQGDVAPARATIDRTLADSRDMVEGLLQDASISAGELVRAAPAPSAGVPVGVEAAPDATQRIRVLLADDAVDLRVMLRVRLSKLNGVEVIAEASDGEEAIALVDELSPDVVVLDLSMPKLDGLQAAEELRSRHPDLRIIVLSGYPSASMESLALAAGADQYVEKGPDLSVLERAVQLTPAS